jgi:hypothetical protein
MDQLPASPSGKCQVMDGNGIYYVQKCKNGKICKEGEDFENGKYYGVCIDFVLPNFVGDACAANEECISQNCDGTKCDEPKEACFTDLQCDYGKYCNTNKTSDNILVNLNNNFHLNFDNLFKIKVIEFNENIPYIEKINILTEKEIENILI